MQNRENNQVNAGFFVRLAAHLIDWVVVNGCLLLVRVPMWISSLANPENIMKKEVLFEFSLLDILLYVLSTLYYVILTYSSGATIGKRALHLQVKSVEDRKMTFFEVVFRETIGKYLSGLILSVGYLMIGVRADKKGLHDLLSDTEVVYSHHKKEFVTTPVNVTSIPISMPYVPQQIPNEFSNVEETAPQTYIFSAIPQQNLDAEEPSEQEEPKQSEEI